MAQAYDALAFSQACEMIMALVRAGNKYVDERAPWALFKQGKKAELEQVLYTVLESVRLAAYLLSPIIPSISNAVYRQLGFSIDFNQQGSGTSAHFSDHAQWGTLTAGQTFGEPEPIFQRLELP